MKITLRPFLQPTGLLRRAPLNTSFIQPYTVAECVLTEHNPHERLQHLLKEALALREKALGADHPDVAADLNNLAALYFSQGRYAEAEPLDKRALGIRQKTLEPDHPDLALSLENYAAVLRPTGRETMAAELETRAKAIRSKAK